MTWNPVARVADGRDHVRVGNTIREAFQQPPSAGAVRAPWTTLPEPVRAWIESWLGSPVASAENQPGGFSPGLAARVRTIDGRRAFVKACGPELNPRTPEILRSEIAIAQHLPDDLPTATLRGFAGVDPDDETLDGWVVLIFDELDATLVATPWNESDVLGALRMLDDLATIGTPAPVADLPTAAELLSLRVAGYAELAAAPPDDLDPWEFRHLDHLAELGLSALEASEGDSLVHFDVRSDNILVNAAGRMWLVDWPWAGRGAAWTDAVSLLLDVALYGGDPQRYESAAGTLDGVDPDAVTALVASLAGIYAERSRHPDPPGLPTLRTFQRANHDVALKWLRQRRPDLR